MVERSGRNFNAWFTCDSHHAELRRMLELPVTASHPPQSPTICFKHFNDILDLHGWPRMKGDLPGRGSSVGRRANRWQLFDFGAGEEDAVAHDDVVVGAFDAV